MRKRFISILMIFAMFFAIVPVMAETTETTEPAKPAATSVFESVSAKTVAQMNNLILSSGALGDPSTGGWGRFDNLDFGESGIESMQVQVGLSSAYSGATVKFYIDEIAGSPFAEVTIPATGGWTVLKWVEATLHNGDIYGVHSVYVQYANSGKGNVAAFKMTPMASAEEDLSVPASVKGSGKEEQFKILNSLGIISWEAGNAFDLNKELTAEEFIKTALNFKGKYDSKEVTELLEKCSIKKSDKITVEKASEVLVRLLNRDLIMKEGDSNYLIAAKEAGVTCQAGQEDNVTWLTALDLLYTTLEAEPVTLSDIDDVGTKYNAIYTIRENNTLLAEYRDIHKAEGVVTMDSVTGLDKVSDIQDGNVLIDNYIFETGKCNISGLLGYKTEFYYQADDDENTLLYITKSEDNEVTELTAHNVESYKSRTLKYRDEGGRQKSIDVLESAKIIYNGIAVSKYDDAMFNIKGGSIELISNDNDNAVDVVKLWNTTDYFAAGVFDDVLVLKDTQNKTIDFDKDGIEYVVLNKGGQEYDYTKITEDAVCTIAEATSIDGSFTYYTIWVSKGTVSGMINAYDDGNYEIEVDGTVLPVSKAFAERETTISAGNEVKLYLNKYGEVAFRQSESEKDKLGYFVKIWDNEDTGEKYIRIFTEDNEMIIYNTNEKLTVDGVRVDSDFSALFDGQECKSGLILYSVDKAGYVRKIKFAQENATGDEENGLYHYVDLAGAKYKTGSRSVYGQCILSSNFTLFKVPKAKDDYEDYQVTGISFEEDDPVTMECYSREQGKLEVSIGVYYYTPKTEAPSGARDIYYVADKELGVNAEGEVVTMLSFYNGTGKKLLTYEVDEKIADSVKDIKTGDAIRAVVEKGKIASLKTIFRIEDHSVPTTTNVNAQTRIEHGRVAKKQDGIIQLEKSDGTLVNNGEPMNCSGATVYIYEDGELSVGSLNDVYSSEFYGNGSEVYVYQKYFTVRSIVVVVNRESD